MFPLQVKSFHSSKCIHKRKATCQKCGKCFDCNSILHASRETDYYQYNMGFKLLSSHHHQSLKSPQMHDHPATEHDFNISHSSSVFTLEWPYLCERGATFYYQHRTRSTAYGVALFSRQVMQPAHCGLAVMVADIAALPHDLKGNISTFQY